MASLVEIPLRPLTPEGFAPFGQIIGDPGASPVFTGPTFQSWSLDFEVEDDGPAELMFIRYIHQRPFAFSALERHLNVTQTFVPLGGAESVMVVAPPARPHSDGVPDPADVRAFHFPGDRGLMLWCGTWHAPTRFPVRPSGAAFAFITGRDTQRELERQLADGTRPKLTDVVDYRERAGITFEVVDPGGLLGGA